MYYSLVDIPCLLHGSVIHHISLSLLEGDMSSSSGISIVKNKKNGKLLLEFSSFDEESPDNSFSRDGYDVILRCLGFKVRA